MLDRGMILECIYVEVDIMTTDTALAATIPPNLSAANDNNTLGQHLRQLWDTTRATGQTHGVWCPALWRFVTLDELAKMEAQMRKDAKP